MERDFFVHENAGLEWTAAFRGRRVERDCAFDHLHGDIDSHIKPRLDSHGLAIRGFEHTQGELLKTISDQRGTLK